MGLETPVEVVRDARVERAVTTSQEIDEPVGARGAAGHRVALGVWRRSSLPLLATEQGTQGGKDLGWQGGDARGEVGKGIGIACGPCFGPTCSTDVGFDVALCSPPCFPAVILRLFDSPWGYSKGRDPRVRRDYGLLRSR